MTRRIASSLAPRLARTACVALLVGGLSACVTVNVVKDGQTVDVIRGFGVVRVEATDPQRSVVGALSGVGIVHAPLGWSVGYTRQRWALLGEDCRAVIWPEPGGLDERARAEIARAAGVCIVEDVGRKQTAALRETTP
jgi:hypothetical protein